MIHRMRKLLKKEAANPNMVYFAVPHPKNLTPDELELWKANVSEALGAVAADATTDVAWARTLDTMTEAFGDNHGWSTEHA